MFSWTTINLSRLPIRCSLLSTSLLIPLLFPVFCFALTGNSLDRIWKVSVENQIYSRAFNLSEKWETTKAVKLSLRSPNDFAPEVFHKDWTAAMPSLIVHVLWWLRDGWLWFTFVCKILPRSHLLDASLRHPSSVAIDCRTGESSLCKRVTVSTSTSRLDSRATLIRLNRSLSTLLATVVSLSSETGTGIQSFEGLQLMLL